MFINFPLLLLDIRRPGNSITQGIVIIGSVLAYLEVQSTKTLRENLVYFNLLYLKGLVWICFNDVIMFMVYACEGQRSYLGIFL